MFDVHFRRASHGLSWRAGGAGGFCAASTRGIAPALAEEQISVGSGSGCTATFGSHKAFAVMARTASQAPMMYFTPIVDSPFKSLGRLAARTGR